MRKARSEGGWEVQTDKMKRELGVIEQEMLRDSLETIKNQVKKHIRRCFKTETEKSAESKFKVQFLLQGGVDCTLGKKHLT